MNKREVPGTNPILFNAWGKERQVVSKQMDAREKILPRRDPPRIGAKYRTQQFKLLLILFSGFFISLIDEDISVRFKEEGELLGVSSSFE